MIILIPSRSYFLLSNQRFHRGIFLFLLYYSTLLAIMLVVSVPFFSSHHFNLSQIYSLHDNILHHPSLIRYLGYHLFSIRLILVFLLQTISLILPPHLLDQPFHIILDLKDLSREILMISPSSRPLSLILFIQLKNHLIFHVLILLMDGSVFLLRILIASLMFVLLIPMKY